MVKKATYCLFVIFVILTVCLFKMPRDHNGKAIDPQDNLDTQPGQNFNLAPKGQSQDSNLDPKEQSTPEVSSSAGRVEQVGRHEQSEKMEVTRESVDLRENERANLVGQSFTNTDWHDSGFNTAASAIETYYWAMRDGVLSRRMDCMSPRELEAWQLLTKGREDVIQNRYSAAVHHASRYDIESVVRVGRDEYFIKAKRILDSGDEVLEYFTVSRIGEEWKISGESGFLNYVHHPGDESKFRAFESP